MYDEVNFYIDDRLICYIINFILWNLITAKKYENSTLYKWQNIIANNNSKRANYLHDGGVVFIAQGQRHTEYKYDKLGKHIGMFSTIQLPTIYKEEIKWYSILEQTSYTFLNVSA